MQRMVSLSVVNSHCKNVFMELSRRGETKVIGERQQLSYFRWSLAVSRRGVKIGLRKRPDDVRIDQEQQSAAEYSR